MTMRGDAIFVGRLSHLERIHVGTDVLDVMKLRTERIVTYRHMSDVPTTRGSYNITLCLAILGLFMHLFLTLRE